MRGYPMALSMGIPGLYRLNGPLPPVSLPPGGGRLLQVDCSGARSREEILAHFSAALQAPSALRNWDALLDALRDLSWLDGQARIVLVITGLAVLQETGRDAYETLSAVLVDAAGHWARRPEEAPLFVVEQPPEARTDP